MNPSLYTYAQLRNRHHLPSLRRHLGAVERDTAQCTAAIEHNRRQGEFSAPTCRTKHRPEAGACDLMVSYGVDDLRGLHGKRERLLAAIAQLEARNEPPRRLSNEARRAIAELPGTAPFIFTVGQNALAKAVTNSRGVQGKRTNRKGAGRPRTRMARIVAAA